MSTLRIISGSVWWQLLLVIVVLAFIDVTLRSFTFELRQSQACRDNGEVVIEVWTVHLRMWGGHFFFRIPTRFGLKIATKLDAAAERQKERQ